MLFSRSLPDVGHPPLFDVIYWSLGSVLGESVHTRRLSNALIGAALILPGLIIMRPSHTRHAYRPALLLALFASPFVLGKFAEHRSYFVDACAVLAVLLSAREIVIRQALEQGISTGLLLWLFVTSAVATNLDYTNSLAVLPLLLITARWVWNRERRLAMLIVLCALVPAFAVGAQLSVAVKLGVAVPSSQVPLLRGLAAVLATIASGFLVVLPLIPAAARNARASASGLAQAAAARREFALLLAWSLSCTIICYLLIQSISQALLARHAVPAIPLASSLIVELATMTILSPLAALTFSGLAIGASWLTAVDKSRDAGWETFAPIIAREAADCAGTKVIAIDPALMISGSGGHPQVGMKEAIRTSFRSVGAIWNFDVTLARPRQTLLPSGQCPTILWLEHNFMAPNASPRTIAKAAGLQISDAQLNAGKRLNSSHRTLVFIPAHSAPATG
jgi:hypothetical protein